MADINTAFLAWLAANTAGGDLNTAMRDSLASAEGASPSTDLNTLITQYDFNSTDPGGTLREMPPQLRAVIAPVVEAEPDDALEVPWIEVPVSREMPPPAIVPEPITRVHVLCVVSTPAPQPPLEIPAEVLAAFAAQERAVQTFGDDVRALRAEFAILQSGHADGVLDRSELWATVRDIVSQMDDPRVEALQHGLAAVKTAVDTLHGAHAALDTRAEALRGVVRALEGRPVYEPPPAIEPVIEAPVPIVASPEPVVAPSPWWQRTWDWLNGQ